MRIYGQEIVQWQNSSETASKVENVGLRGKQALRQWLLWIKGESPRQHSAQETITFPAEILTGLFGPSFVKWAEGLHRLIGSGSSRGDLMDIILKLHFEYKDYRAMLPALHKCVQS